VCHVASPVEFDGTDFKKDFLAPALNGTKGVLEAAAKEGSVKAVVLTSTYGTREP
jgi:nucleoside-diphosphate-sugar epimerase